MHDSTNALYYYAAIYSCMPEEVVDKRGKITTTQPSCEAADMLYVVSAMQASAAAAHPPRPSPGKNWRLTI